jgi:hypothetical protein
MSKGRRRLCPLPSQGSYLIHTFLPLPAFQANLFHIRSKDFKTNFHITEHPRWSLRGSLIHSRIDLGTIYFCCTTFVHRLGVEIKHHKSLATSAFENRKVFLRPHPSRDFGTAILSPLTHDITCFSFVPLHRYEKQSLLVFSKIPFGIQDKYIQ